MFTVRMTVTPASKKMSSVPRMPAWPTAQGSRRKRMAPKMPKILIGETQQATANGACVKKKAAPNNPSARPHTRTMASKHREESQACSSPQSPPPLTWTCELRPGDELDHRRQRATVACSCWRQSSACEVPAANGQQHQQVVQHLFACGNVNCSSMVYLACHGAQIYAE